MKKLTNPSFAREQEELKRLTKALNEKIRPQEDELAQAGREAYEDPFGHLRNKELGNEIVSETIENFEIYNDNSNMVRGLDME